MANYDITSQLQEFLTNNTPGGYHLPGQQLSGDYYQTDPPSSSALPNAEEIRAILNQEHVLRENSEIGYNQLNNDAKDNLFTYIQQKLSTLATTGKYKDLLRHPTFPEGYNTWLVSDVADPPAFQKVAFTGEYSDLNNYPDLTGYAKSSDLATVAKTGKFSDLTMDGNIPSPTIDIDALATAVAPKITLSELDGYQGFVNSISTNAADTVFIHNILGNRCQLSNLKEGQYDTRDYLTEESEYQIKDLLENMYKEFYTVVETTNGTTTIDSTAPFKETIIKLIFNWGTCILLGIEEYNDEENNNDDIIKFTFSYVDGKTEAGLTYLSRHPLTDIDANIEAYMDAKIKNTEVEYFFPCFYYDRTKNKLLVRRDYQVLLANLATVAVSGEYTDVRNIPKIVEYDITNNGVSDLRNLVSTTINNIENATFEGNKKIKDWLEDIIKLYNTKTNDGQQLPTFINLKTDKGTIKLITINKKSSTYIFEFSSITEINDETFEKYQIFFLYNRDNNTLQIKRI